VDEHILPDITGDEAISFGVVEPLDGSSLSLGHFLLLLHLWDLETKQGGRDETGHPVSASLGGP
jgi:hypothetical protein